MGLFQRFKADIINTFVSILKGHGVTWKNMWRERVTLQYPNERPELPPTYRGIPGVHPEVCIVCGACAKVCPVQVISMEGKKIPGTKHRELTRFYIEAGRCMFCGLCEEACPTKPVKAIRMSWTYELAAANKESLILDIPRLLEIWKSKPVGVPEEEYMATTPRKLAERDLAAKESGEAPAPRPGARAAAVAAAHAGAAGGNPSPAGKAEGDGAGEARRAAAPEPEAGQTAAAEAEPAKEAAS